MKKAELKIFFLTVVIIFAFSRCIRANRTREEKSQIIETEKNFLEVLVREEPVNRAGESEYVKRITSRIGKTVEMSVHYRSKQNVNAKGTFIKIEIPYEELEYISDTAKIIRIDSKNGGAIENEKEKGNENYKVEKGIYLGNYFSEGEYEIRLKCRLKRVDWDKFGGNIKVGAAAYDGIGCYSDWAEVSPENSEIQVTQELRLGGSEVWESSITAIEGDFVEFRVAFKNKSGKCIANTKAQVYLPEGLEYMKDSVSIRDKIFWNGRNESKEDEARLFRDGVDIGRFKDGEEAYIYYAAKVVPIDLPKSKEEILAPKVTIVADDLTNDYVNEIKVH